jgi:hypothetical protein
MLEMLKSPRPEPSTALLERILAQTSGLAGPAKSHASGLSVVPPLEIHTIAPATFNEIGVTPAALGTNVLQFRPVANKFTLRSMTHTMMQPRLAMTAAMAFFSIALTLNLTGVRLTDLRPSDLKPSNLKHTFYQADASVVRYYDNLRVVYELESRVRDLRSNDNDGPNSPISSDKSNTKDGLDKNKPGENQNNPKDQQRKQSPKAGSGTSQRHYPLQQDFRLADEHEAGNHSRTSDSAAVILPRFLVTPNKSKEELQEGGSV